MEVNPFHLQGACDIHGKRCLTVRGASAFASPLVLLP